MAREYFVYILASRPRGVLYTGVTNNLERRVWEHRRGLGSSFVTRYGVKRLVHVEGTDQVLQAIAREKQIKSGTRRKKLELVERENPEWLDLLPER